MVVILVRACHADKFIGTITGKTFPMGTDITTVKDYVNSLIKDNLISLEVKIIVRELTSILLQEPMKMNPDESNAI